MNKVELFKEVLLFGVIVFFVILFSRLFFYDAVQREVRKTSRCVRERFEHGRSGVYSVVAKNSLNSNLYKISYDLKNKKHSIECACRPGDIVNTFKEIPYYDFNTQSAQVLSEKLCQCENKLIEGTDKPFYAGTPGIIRFMNNKTDTKFFH